MGVAPIAHPRIRIVHLQRHRRSRAGQGSKHAPGQRDDHGHGVVRYLTHLLKDACRASGAQETRLRSAPPPPIWALLGAGSFKYCTLIRNKTCSSQSGARLCWSHLRLLTNPEVAPIAEEIPMLPNVIAVAAVAVRGESFVVPSKIVPSTPMETPVGSIFSMSARS